MDAAGLTFCLTWLSLCAVVVQAVCYLLQAYMWSMSLKLIADAFYVASVTLLAASILVMSVTYVDLSAVVHMRNSFKRVRAFAFACVVVIGLIGSLCFSLASLRAWTLALIIIFALLILGAVLGPFTLYSASAYNMATTAGRKPPRWYKLVEAVFVELVYGNRAMRRALGLYGTDSDDDDLSGSKDSKESSKEVTTIVSMMKKMNGSFRSSMGKNFSLTATPIADDVILNKTPGESGSASPLDANAPVKLKKFFIESKSAHDASHMAHVRRRETALIKFLGRSVRANFFLALFLLGYIGSSVSLLYWDGQYDDSTTVRNFALSVAFQLLCFELAVYQILWFFVGFFALVYRSLTFAVTK